MAKTKKPNRTGKPNPQWPSKIPGKPSGPKRGNNPKPEPKTIVKKK